MKFEKVGRFQIATKNLTVAPEHVDNVTVFEKDGNQYFTFDAAQIHAKLQGMRLPTKEEWEELTRYHSEWIIKNLPLAGYRIYSSAAYDGQGTYGNYWASSPTGTYGYNVILSATQAYPANNSNRANGFSVRCLKNS